MSKQDLCKNLVASLLTVKMDAICMKYLFNPDLTDIYKEDDSFQVEAFQKDFPRASLLSFCTAPFIHYFFLPHKTSETQL